MRAKRIAHIFGVLLPKQRSFITKEPMQSLRCEGQEGGEHHLERVDGSERGVDRFCCSVAVGFNCCPWCSLVEVLVDGGGEFHRFADGRTQTHGFKFRAYSVE